MFDDEEVVDEFAEPEQRSISVDYTKKEFLHDIALFLAAMALMAIVYVLLHILLPVSPSTDIIH